MKIRSSVISSFALGFMLAGCKQRSHNDSELSPSEAPVQSLTGNPESYFPNTRFHLITPTGAKIFAAMKDWEKGQLSRADYFAQPAMCATNASRVLEMAGVTGYSSPLLIDMVNGVKKRGGIVIQLPKDPKAIAAKIKTVFGGRIPVGSFVSGCLRADCSGEAGDGHIALVGDIDDSGYIKIYHNNWYRPDNDPQRIWRNYMIPMDWYNKGYRRLWMPTPWIYLKRDAAGLPENLLVKIPAIDDLDPTNYFVTLSVPVELIREVKANQGKITDGKGDVKPFVVSGGDAPSEPPKLADCNKLEIVDKKDPAGVNLRAAPAGAIKCKVANGTMAERIGTEGQWIKVRAACSGTGGQQEGFVFSFLTLPACKMER